PRAAIGEQNMTVKEINITFLVETDDVLATINAIDEEVKETLPLEPEDKITLTLIHSFKNTYSTSYHIKTAHKHEPTDDTESQTEASDSYPDGREPLPPEF